LGDRHRGRLRLRRVGGARPVDNHDVQALLGEGPPQVALDHPGGKVQGPGPAGAGDAPAIDHEQSIGHRCYFREFVDQVVVVEPAHAAAPAGHQPGADQSERAGTHADKGHALAVGFPQVLKRGVV